MNTPSAKNDPASGCVTFVVAFVIPLMSAAVAAIGLISGAVLTIHCERIEPRVVEEVTETRGVVTTTAERAIKEGRIDIVITKKILGLVPIRRLRLEDVVTADSSSGTSSVTNNAGRVTSRYQSGTIELATRGGRTWRSSEISHSFGSSPAEMREAVHDFIAKNSEQTLTLRSIPWLSNVIGIPFALVALLFLWSSVKKLVQRLA